MADDDKTADNSKPARASDGSSKTGSATSAGVSQPPSVTSSAPAKVDPKAKPIDKPGADKTAADRSSPDTLPPGPRNVAAKPGSEWTESDNRGPLGRAPDEGVEATSAGRDEAAKTPAKESRDALGARMSSSAAAGAKSGPIAADKLKPAAGKPGIDAPGAAKSAAVPPVDAPVGGARSGAATASQPATSKPAGKPEEAKRSLWPVAAALILGAVIGAGSAAFVYRGYADDGQPDPKLADLTARVDALEKRPNPQAAIGTLKSSLAALDKQVGAMRAGQGGSAPQPRANPQPAAPRAADLDEMQKQLAALQAKFDEPKLTRDTKALEDKIQALQSEIDATKSEATATRTSVAAVQGKQKEIVDRAMMPALAVVADSLVDQIDHGQAYATQVDALASLGADPAKVAVLRQNSAKGVPSARELDAKFEPLAQPIVATATKAPANAGLGERLKSGMFSIVSVRRADDTSGDDLPSRVARIKTALDHDNVAAAFETWNKLPPDAKAKSEAWGALVKTHVEAMDAARALQQDAIAALGSKKS